MKTWVERDKKMDVMLIFDVVVALFGAYMIFSALQMKKSGKINSMVLAQEELKKVKDTKGFIEFLYWREMLFGALVLIVGFLGLLNETIISIGKASILEVIIFLAAFINNKMYTLAIAENQTKIYKNTLSPKKS